MSVNYDDILMWAHYADNNEGICIVFDKEIITNSLGPDAGRVTYSGSITKANFHMDGNSGRVISDKSFFMDKLDRWADESEFRFVKKISR